jgi:hypothetical protein
MEMKILLLILGLFGTIFADSDNNRLSFQNYDRVIMLVSRITIPKGTSLPPVNINAIVDVGFVRHNTYLRFYTPAQLEQQRLDIFNDFAVIYGLNFSQGFPLPAYGAYCLPRPSATSICIFPYTRIGDPAFPINYDNHNPRRNGVWVLHNIGWMAVNDPFGTAPSCAAVTGLGNYSGLKNQTIAYPGDLLQFGYLSFAHPELGVNKTYTNPNNSRYREEFKTRPLWPSRQTPDGEGASSTHGKEQTSRRNSMGQYPSFDEITDDNGYESSAVHRAIQPNGDSTYYGTAMWSWPGRNQLQTNTNQRRGNNYHHGRKWIDNSLPPLSQR